MDLAHVEKRRGGKGAQERVSEPVWQTKTRVSMVKVRSASPNIKMLLTRDGPACSTAGFRRDCDYPSECTTVVSFGILFSWSMHLLEAALERQDSGDFSTNAFFFPLAELFCTNL